MSAASHTFSLPTRVPSSREREIWRLVALDWTDKQIAAELRISLRTVTHHRQHLHSKLGTHTPVGLAREALRHGIITLEALLA